MSVTAKLTRVGNSTGVTLPREVLAAAGFERGDTVSVTAQDGRIEITKADDAYNRYMEAGRLGHARYRRTMAALAK
jgi:putative addiction module antidote